jgi:hypothetical protein
MSIESAMTPRSAYAVFEVKTRGPKANLSSYHLTALEELLEVAEMDLARLARVVKNVPVVMSKRPAINNSVSPH